MSEQSTLLVDIGNSAIKWCSCLQADIYAADLSDKLTMLQKIYPKNISPDFFLKQWRQLEAPANIVVSCVAADSVFVALQQACRQLWSVEPVRVTSVDKNFIFLNKYKDPAKLGDDRFCAMVAAYHNTNTDCIVVDCGSAITIDIVALCEGEQRTHQGGYILPGLNLMKASLEQQTADVRVDKTQKSGSLFPGDTTEKCVDAAIYLSAVGLIESVFKQQQREGMQCILTGGDAEELATFLSIKYSIIPELVLQGLAYIFRRQKIQK